GIEMNSGELADAVVAASFKRNLIIETCGNDGQVVKVFAALNVEIDELHRGLGLLEEAVAEVAKEHGKSQDKKVKA
ncbi:MAG: diaminobutyrate--2-oxoglutarate transaminase, partial [Limnobacter sp.]|nr:diaminobutyrate--2-oxoglutarate transaminase [Limnobacter sp.]